MTTVLDYGLNNLSSVIKAIRFLGFEARTATTIADDTSRLIIPGVGAFGAAMAQLRELREPIREFAASGRPVFGICLGMQLLADASDEFGTHAGLGLIPGMVRYLPREAGLKVPHIGWSAIAPRPDREIVTGVRTGDFAYFVHSLHLVCDEPADVAATCEYGVTFTAAVQRGNVWGTQFHPEKSSQTGMTILRSFLTCS
ncbi:MAG: imidazole glycerol phosphate synthase subunit HisH [Fimbriimonadaceae bacterium]|nr:imidazole glycerol phosphate synthase subunit HisH [Fimbriimonadaceae bacterium]